MTAGTHMHARRARVTASLAVLSAAAMVPLLPGAAGAASSATTKASVQAAASTCTAAFSMMPAPAAGELLSTAAISSSNAWAVGYAGRTALTIHWNGTKWTAVPNRAAKTSTLFGVAGSAANNVWAVGNAGGFETYTEHWNGSRWTTKPNPSPPSGTLSAVSTISTSSAWAVGYSYQAGGTGGGYVPLAEHWNGHAWTISPIALTGELEGVVEISAKDVWAVGQETFGLPGGSFTGGPLALNWNGSTWTQYSIADSTAQLRAVSADSASDVWAVGDGSTGAVTEHWNGVAWASMPTPSFAASSLRGVVAVSPTSVWVVGDYLTTPDLAQETLAEHWNGISWTVVPSASVASATNYLFSVAATGTTTSVWAVGSSSTTKTQGVVESACA